MPRQARLDAPGALHHVMIRGIERRAIFRSDKDRDDFLNRLDSLLPESETVCYAWTFLSNHAHFLLRSGPKGIAALMRRLLTGYAVSFNLRHHRHGQLKSSLLLGGQRTGDGDNRCGEGFGDDSLSSGLCGWQGKEYR